MSDPVVDPEPVVPTLPDPDLKLAPIAVENPSSTPEELDAKISEELGIPPTKKAADPEPPVVDPEDPEPEVDPEDPEPSEPEEPPTPEPTPPATPSDEDLFVEIEDANGVTHKISRIEDLPDDFEPKNNRQALEILQATQNLDAERTRRESDAATAAEEKLVKNMQTAQFKSWDAEIAELAKTDRVDIKDTDQLNDVFGYMNEINKMRQKAGNPNLITSFEDALDKYEVKQAADKAEEEKKNGNAAAKIKTAVIGKSSAAAGADHYVYRAGSARSIDDIPL